MTGRGIGGHHRPNEGLNDEWLTPPGIIEALGPFDLDPCSPIERPWPTAAQHYTSLDDGLTQPWAGLVWLNPPYGQTTWRWLGRLADHPEGGIALIFARTETAGFVETVWGRASGMYFLAGRLFFHRVDGVRADHNSGAPSVLVAYGVAGLERLASRVDRLPPGVLIDKWTERSPERAASLF